MGIIIATPVNSKWLVRWGDKLRLRQNPNLMGILGKDEQQAFFKMIYLVIADKKMKDNLQPFLTHTY